MNNIEYDKNTYAYWAKNKNVTNIIPQKFEKEGVQFPEGWDVLAKLKETMGYESVVEVGCGYGRLVDAFTPTQYKGFDINPYAIEKAKKRHPNYDFELFDLKTLPASTWVLLYTVLLHVSDNDIDSFLETITSKCSKIFLAEIMKETVRKPPKPGKPPVFNRTSDSYIKIFHKFNFRVILEQKKAWYIDPTKFTIMVLEKIM